MEGRKPTLVRIWFFQGISVCSAICRDSSQLGRTLLRINFLKREMSSVRSAEPPAQAGREGVYFTFH